MKPSSMLRIFALAYGLVAHGTFAVSVGCMAWSLWNGLQGGLGRLHGVCAVVADALLVAQFPLLHSFLLTGSGRRALRAIAPWGGGRLQTTTYALVASAQLLLAFLLWSPSGLVWSRPDGASMVAHATLFGGAWLFLVKALWDAGLALQTGASGWTAVFLGREVRYGGMPERGLFRACRQPIYLGFALVLVTAPCRSLDWLCLCVGWTSYCLVGPLLKERRWLRIHGERFLRYRSATPYMIPRFPR